MTARGGQTLAFDVENRLSHVQGTGDGYTGTSTYVYDGDGKRIKKSEGGNTTVYVNKYYEKDITSGTATSHYYLGGTQIAIKKGSTLEYLHQDHLNSSSLSTDSSGSQISAMKVFSFGDRRNSTGTSGTDKQFTGQRLDGTDLYFYNARYYDAAVGRFISPDQFVQNGPGFGLVLPALTVNLAKTGYEAYPRTSASTPIDPQTLNRYSYVLNNPLRYTDPYGWWTFGIFLNIFAGLGGGVSISIGLFVDGRGNIGGVLTTGGGGVAGATLSAGAQLQYTGADTLYDLQGASNQSGFSVNPNAVPVSAGLENVLGLGERPYEGVNVNIGVGVGSPFEMHSTVDYSDVDVFGWSFGDAVDFFKDLLGTGQDNGSYQAPLPTDAGSDYWDDWFWQDW